MWFFFIFDIIHNALSDYLFALFFLFAFPRIFNNIIFIIRIFENERLKSLPVSGKTICLNYGNRGIPPRWSERWLVLSLWSSVVNGTEDCRKHIEDVVEIYINSKLKCVQGSLIRGTAAIYHQTGWDWTFLSYSSWKRNNNGF